MTPDSPCHGRRIGSPQAPRSVSKYRTIQLHVFLHLFLGLTCKLHLAAYNRCMYLYSAFITSAHLIAFTSNEHLDNAKLDTAC